MTSFRNEKLKLILDAINYVLREQQRKIPNPQFTNVKIDDSWKLFHHCYLNRGSVILMLHVATQICILDRHRYIFFTKSYCKCVDAFKNPNGN